MFREVDVAATTFVALEALHHPRGVIRCGAYPVILKGDERPANTAP